MANETFPFGRPPFPFPDPSNPTITVHAPGIQARPDVCGGRPTVGNWRIEPWHVVKAARAGGFDAALGAYPVLEPQGIALALCFALQHPEWAEEPAEDAAPCPDRQDGRPHVFTPDYAYDESGGTITCEHCGMSAPEA